MKILLTGATGFIGQEILSKLNSDNYQVIGIARNSIDHSGSNDKDKYLAFINVDIKIRSDVQKLLTLGKIDAVIHCAGLAHQFGDIDEELFRKVNIVGTKNICELAAQLGAQQFILISSTAVYGYHQNLVDETTICRPETEYARSKLVAESACREICEQNKIPLTILRLAPVLGEKGIGNVPRLIKTINKKRFIWLGNGSNKKSLIYVGDVANACVRLLESKKNLTEVFNVAADPIEMRELVSIISETLKKPVPKISIPITIPKTIFKINSKIFKIGVIKNISGTIDKWLSDDIYSAESIKNKYGFKPETSIKTAVVKQCRWFINKSDK